VSQKGERTHREIRILLSPGEPVKMKDFA